MGKATLGNAPRETPVPPRERILEEFRKAGTSAYVSGEELSKLLGISRAAVAKHVGVLRAGGCEIEASPRRGYRMLAEADDYSCAAVRSLLGTRVLGAQGFAWLEEASSTNTEAARRAMDGAPEGLVVVANRQLAGRGRKGRQWFTAPQSIACSVLLRPSFSVASQKLAEMAQSAVAGAVEKATGLRPVCKPPNDVLLNGRKICGILVETGMRALDMEWAVVGIGVNVNARAEAFTGTLAGVATSMCAESGRRIDRVRFLCDLLERLEARYFALSRDALHQQGA